MGANDKLAAVFHPDDDVQPMGEDPGLPPFARRSGAAAVLNACAANDQAIRHAENLQAAVNEIRQLAETEYTAYPLLVIRNILERWGV